MKCGIKIDIEQITLAIVSDNGDFILAEAFVLPPSPEELIQLICTWIEQKAEYTLSSIGIALPGFYNCRENHIHSFHISWLHQTKIKHLLQARLNIKVVVSSLGQALAASYMSAYPTQSVFALHASEDVSAGLAVSGNMMLGAHGLAGNWGHISLPWPVEYECDGRICWCGKTGCLAHFVSSDGLAHDYELLTNSKASAKDIIKRSQNGDIVAESVIQVLEDRIARGLALVCNLIDPDVIILGGYLGKIERLATSIPRKWPGYSQIGNFTVTLLLSAFDDNSNDRKVLLGASLLASQAKS